MNHDNVNRQRLAPRRDWRGVFFNPQIDPDPNYPWLLHYDRQRDAVRRHLQDIRKATRLNLLDVFVIIPNSLCTPARGNQWGDPPERWLHLPFVEHVGRFVDDCWDEGLSVELDLVDNRWIPYSIDSAAQIGRPGDPWWPTAGDRPWLASAVWYRTMILTIESAARHREAIAMWSLMGNYHHGAAEPVLWDDDVRPDIKRYTERFVKHVWPVFMTAGARPKASPILLPIFARNPYWDAHPPIHRLSGVRNLKTWLVDDMRLPPDYWLMSTYPFCEPAADGFHYITGIQEILGRAEMRRMVSTDWKGPGHEAELVNTVIDSNDRTAPEALTWNLNCVRTFDMAGWWLWAYQDTPQAMWGVRTLDGVWKREYLEALSVAR